MSREVDPQNIQTAEDFVYLAQRNQLPQEWIDANGGAEGVGEIMRGERKVKKPKAQAKTEEAEAAPEEMEEESEEEEASGEEETPKATAASKRTR